MSFVSKTIRNISNVNITKISQKTIANTYLIKILAHISLNTLHSAAAYEVQIPYRSMMVRVHIARNVIIVAIVIVGLCCLCCARHNGRRHYHQLPDSDIESNHQVTSQLSGYQGSWTGTDDHKWKHCNGGLARCTASHYHRKQAHPAARRVARREGAERRERVFEFFLCPTAAVCAIVGHFHPCGDNEGHAGRDVSTNDPATVAQYLATFRGNYDAVCRGCQDHDCQWCSEVQAHYRQPDPNIRVAAHEPPLAPAQLAPNQQPHMADQPVVVEPVIVVAAANVAAHQGPDPPAPPRADAPVRVVRAYMDRQFDRNDGLAPQLPPGAYRAGGPQLHEDEVHHIVPMENQPVMEEDDEAALHRNVPLHEVHVEPPQPPPIDLGDAAGPAYLPHPPGLEPAPPDPLAAVGPPAGPEHVAPPADGPDDLVPHPDPYDEEDNFVDVMEDVGALERVRLYVTEEINAEVPDGLGSYIRSVMDAILVQLTVDRSDFHIAGTIGGIAVSHQHVQHVIRRRHWYMRILGFRDYTITRTANVQLTRGIWNAYYEVDVYQMLASQLYSEMFTTNSYGLDARSLEYVIPRIYERIRTEHSMYTTSPADPQIVLNTVLHVMNIFQIRQTVATGTLHRFTRNNLVVGPAAVSNLHFRL